MSHATVPPLGSRIRSERTRQRLSVRGLAREIGVSASLISQIETDKSHPSVSTLYAITTALNITVESLFDQPATSDLPAEVPTTVAHLRTTPREPKHPGVQRRRDRRQPQRRLPIVRPAERESLTLDSGVIWERLGQAPNTHVDFLQITYPPGSTSSSSGQLMRHSGFEYGYLTKGSLVLTLGFDEYRLRAGDAVSFDSTTPHGYRNDGLKPAIGVWFVAEQADRD